MAKPPIEYRPKVGANVTIKNANSKPLPVTASEILEAYKAAERAKVLARVKKHRAKKAGNDAVE